MLKPTVTVSEHGGIASGAPRVSYWQGFAALLDFTTPPVRIAILPPGEPTAIGIFRTGNALRDAMAAFEKTRP